MADMFMECFAPPRGSTAEAEPDIDIPGMELADPVELPIALTDEEEGCVEREAEITTWVPAGVTATANGTRARPNTPRTAPTGY
jgi:hypothetical protein